MDFVQKIEVCRQFREWLYIQCIHLLIIDYYKTLHLAGKFRKKNPRFFSTNIDICCVEKSIKQSKIFIFIVNFEFVRFNDTNKFVSFGIAKLAIENKYQLHTVENSMHNVLSPIYLRVRCWLQIYLILPYGKFRNDFGSVWLSHIARVNPGLPRFS